MCHEIEEAIRRTKDDEAPGENQITAEILKAYTQLSAKSLAASLNMVWQERRIQKFKKWEQ